MIVNCPIVPDGSTAELRWDGADTGLTLGWYDDQVVFYFNFETRPDGHARRQRHGADRRHPCHLQPQPRRSGRRPASGFMTEDGHDQTHNVVDALPGDAGYSPLWDVDVYDNAGFDSVHDLASAHMAPRPCPRCGSRELPGGVDRSSPLPRCALTNDPYARCHTEARRTSASSPASRTGCSAPDGMVLRQQFAKMIVHRSRSAGE